MEETKKSEKFDLRVWIKEHDLGIRLGLLGLFTILFFLIRHYTVVPTEEMTKTYFWPCIALCVLIWWAVLSKHRIPVVLPWLFCAIVPISQLLLLEAIQQHTRDIVPKMLWLNVIFFYLAFLFVFMILRRHSELAVLITTLFALVSATVNSFCWEFRSLPVLPWDLYSVKTGLSVAADYQYTYTYKFWFVELAFVTLMILGFRLRVRHWAPHPVHWPFAAVTTAALCAFVLFAQTDAIFTDFGGYRYLFTPTVYYERNGTAISFLSTLRYLRVDKPEGYNIDKVEAITNGYAEIEGEYEYPNVIVIMNEAFSDLRALGAYETNIPVTPFIDSLTEDTVKGDLYVSVKGGNTANTEYEFLMGGSMAFLPVGSIPYQQYIKDATPSLATRLGLLGYHTEAIHPYYASGWFRNTVYPMLGFDNSTFWEDLKPVYSNEVVRGYYSDARLFERIIEQYESIDDDRPLFSFAVTMQNHGSYDKEYDNFTPGVKIKGLEHNKRLTAYLSLIRKTDDAFKNLVEYFETVDEKTVIVMFGDHQPNDSVIYPILTLNGVPSTTENLDAENRYITPYVMWANYDIEEATDLDMSVNYLSTMLCSRAGLPLSGYQQFLDTLYDAYPVITAKTVKDSDGKTLDAAALQALLSEEDGVMNHYAALAYAHLFEKKDRPVGFYE